MAVSIVMIPARMTKAEERESLRRENRALKQAMRKEQTFHGILGKSDAIASVEIAGPGFVNFFVRNGVWQSVVKSVCEHGYNYGFSQVGQQKKVLVEFVSANPTGPLSIGHGRQADPLSHQVETAA